MKVTAIKHDESSAVLVGCKELGVELWVDIQQDGDEITADWNKYIFMLDNPEDVKIKAIQEDPENFDLFTSCAMEYFEEIPAINKLVEEFNAITLMKLFEVEVVDNKTGEQEYITFDIEANYQGLKATHVGLTTEEEESKFIAFKSIEWETCHGLDHHLQELFEECTTAITDGNLFNLAH